MRISGVFVECLGCFGGWKSVHKRELDWTRWGRVEYGGVIQKSELEGGGEGFWWRVKELENLSFFSVMVIFCFICSVFLGFDRSISWK
jgi:hypothetical protein